jgi:26S proteasome regulatory subunit N3
MLKYLKMLPEDMATEEPAPEEPAAEKPEEPRTSVTPEIEVYLHTLVVTVLLRHDMVEQATACCTDLLQYAHAINIRTVDPFVSKAWFYYSLCFQKAGKLDQVRRCTLQALSHTLTLSLKLDQIRSSLLAAHRTACLRHDEIGQATLLNLLLRNYIHYNLFDQAFKLVSKTTFPEAISNNQFVRYL